MIKYPRKNDAMCCVSQSLQEYSSINEGGVLRYINRAKSRHGIGLPTTCGYYNCGGKTGFNIIAMFALSYFSLPVNHNTLHHFSLGILSFHMFAYYRRK